MKIGVWAPNYAFVQHSAGLKIDVEIIELACKHFGYEFGICNKENNDFDIVFMMEAVAPMKIIEAGHAIGTKYIWALNSELLSMHTGSVNKKDMVDYYIGKTPGQAEYIESLGWSSPTKLLNFATKVPDIEVNKNERKSLIHFAGRSWFKGSTKQLKAGIKMVQDGHFDKMYLKLSGERKQVQDMIRRMKKLAGDDNRIEIIDRYLTEEEKNELYAKCRVALCASKQEGFGHYILEAAAHGCQVVTTDGNPMRELLEEQVYLAKATRRHPEKPGAIWGYRYGIEIDDICDATMLALEDKHDIDACASNVTKRWNLFLSDFERVMNEIGVREKKETAWELF